MTGPERSRIETLTTKLSPVIRPLIAVIVFLLVFALVGFAIWKIGESLSVSTDTMFATSMGTGAVVAGMATGGLWTQYLSSGAAADSTET